MKLTRTLGAATAAVLALGLAACGGDPNESGSGSDGSSTSIVVGSAAFGENEILESLLRKRQGP